MNLDRPDQTRRRGTDGYDRPEKIRRLDVLNIDTGSWSCLFRPETTGVRSRQIHLPRLPLGVESRVRDDVAVIIQDRHSRDGDPHACARGHYRLRLGTLESRANATLSDASAGAYPVGSSMVPIIESVRVQAPVSKPDATTEWEAIRYLGCRFRTNTQRLHSLCSYTKTSKALIPLSVSRCYYSFFRPNVNSSSFL